MLQGIELIDWRNQNEVIRFYESNKLYFDNFHNITDLESQLNIIDVKLAYCNALIGKHYYSSCLNVLTDLNIMLNRLKSNSINEFSTKNEKYLFVEGVVFGYLKRYEESQINFRELIKIDPKNELYRDWYQSNRLKIIAKQSNIVGYTGCGIIFSEIIADIIFGIKLGVYVDIIGFLIMSLGFAFPYIVKQIDKMKVK